MRVIFLDFDGVINSVRSAVAFGGYPWNVAEESLRLFDPVAVALVRKACAERSAEIVLSSTWRKCFEHKVLGKALDLPIIGNTPYKLGHQPRGVEIQQWLDANKPDEYVIIDDDADMLAHQIVRFIKVDPVNGFSYADYLRLREMLGGSNDHQGKSG